MCLQISRYDFFDNYNRNLSLCYSITIRVSNPKWQARVTIIIINFTSAK